LRVGTDLKRGPAVADGRLLQADEGRGAGHGRSLAQFPIRDGDHVLAAHRPLDVHLLGAWVDAQISPTWTRRKRVSGTASSWAPPAVAASSRSFIPRVDRRASDAWGRAQRRPSTNSWSIAALGLRAVCSGEHETNRIDGVKRLSREVLLHPTPHIIRVHSPQVTKRLRFAVGSWATILDPVYLAEQVLELRHHVLVERVEPPVDPLGEGAHLVSQRIDLLVCRHEVVSFRQRPWGQAHLVLSTRVGPRRVRHLAPVVPSEIFA